jgi:hypothetical protein
MAESFREANQPSPPTKQPILENAVYDREEATSVTGFSLSTLIREEGRGRLKARRQSRRVYYLGRDLLAWLAPEGGTQ